MTARKGAEVASMPSMQAEERPRRPMRWRTWRLSWVRQRRLTAAAVPSGESSSTTMTS